VQLTQFLPGQCLIVACLPTTILSFVGEMILSVGSCMWHVCGILQNAQVLCWGTSLEMKQADLLREGDVRMVPMDPMVSVVGRRFHACGIKSLDHRVSCWGFSLKNTVPAPTDKWFLEIVVFRGFFSMLISC
jgi:hypothetical protein